LRAHKGDEVAHAYLKEPHHPRHIRVLFDQARRAMHNIAPPEQTSGGPSELVARAQSTLNALGYKDGRGRELVVDGRAGPSTHQALARFQTDHGLAPDGQLSESTLGWLKLEPTLDAGDAGYHPTHTHVGASAPGHAYGPPRGGLSHVGPDYCASCATAFPWHGQAGTAVAVSPRQIGDPLYAAMRTPWMGAQGYGAQYITRDQDRIDDVDSPAYRWHWLERNELEGERS
jgi:peptidoglycan hydrolase-like protein with peptidoglycan-binding domain